MGTNEQVFPIKVLEEKVISNSFKQYNYYSFMCQSIQHNRKILFKKQNEILEEAPHSYYTKKST